MCIHRANVSSFCVNSVAYCLVAILLVACASKPLLTDEQIMQADRQGELPAMFEQMVQESGNAKLVNVLQGKDANSDMVRVGKQLAANLARQHKADLKRSLLHSGLTPDTNFDPLRKTLLPMQRWDNSSYQNLLRNLQVEQAKTRALITTKQAEFDHLGTVDAVIKLGLLQEIMQLSGDESSAQRAFPARRSQILAGVFDEGVQLFAVGKYDDARSRFAQIQVLEPDYKNLYKQQSQLEAAVFVAHHKSLQDEKQIEEAFRDYLALSQRRDFADVRKSVASVALELANYYLAQSATAVGDDKLLDAWNGFMRVRQIGKLQSEKNEGAAAEEGKFSEKLFGLVEMADRKQNWGLALGYLAVIEELQPEFPSLKKMLREHADKVYDRALKRVSTAVFAGSTPEQTKVGNAVSSKISQFLFKNLASDIRLVERDQLQAVLREQEITALQNKSGGMQLASADYLIQGTVLDASVESIEKASKKTERVPTGKQSKPNPAFAVWQQKMAAGRGEEGIMPPETIMLPVLEDVSYNVTMLRKIGVLGVAYRIVEATSAKVLHTDTVTEKTSVTSESNEGVKLGEFNVAFKMAELPSDGELYDQLAATVASKIGVQLVKILKNPEEQSIRESVRQKNEENYIDAAERMADALVITQNKNRPVDSLRAEMQLLALQSRQQ